MATRIKSVIAFLAAVMVVATAACADEPPKLNPTVEAKFKQERASQQNDERNKRNNRREDKIYLERGVSFFQLGQNQRALDNLDKVLQFDRQYARAYYVRALVDVNEHQHQRPYQEEAKACSLDSKYCH